MELISWIEEHLAELSLQDNDTDTVQLLREARDHLDGIYSGKVGVLPISQNHAIGLRTIADSYLHPEKYNQS